MKTYHWNEAEDGVLSQENLAQKIEAFGYSVTTYTYSPGTFFPNHTHGVDKMDAVLSGKFKMTTPQGEVILEAGDMLEVPRGTVHSAEVIGDEPVISLDAIRNER